MVRSEIFFQYLSQKKLWLEGQNAPFFLYDPRIIKENLSVLKSRWSNINSDPFHVYFSVKSNPNPHLIQQVMKIVNGFDVSSYAEFSMLRQLQVPYDQITLSGPAKSEKLLLEAIQRKVHAIHIDSFEEYQYVKNLKSTETKLTLRANFGSQISKLGMNMESLEKILQLSNAEELTGFHCYLGRESFSNSIFLATMEKICLLKTKYAEKFRKKFEVFFGPGFPAPKGYEGESAMDLPSDWKTYGFPIHLECGRALLSSAGCYAAPVLAVKKNPQKQIVIIEGGIQHLGGSLLSPVKGDKFLSYYSLQKKLAEKNVSTAIYGSLCTNNDIIHPDLNLPENMQKGDWLIFHPCGAYGITASPNQFIGSIAAREYLLIDPEKSPQEISPDRVFSYHQAFRQTTQN